MALIYNPSILREGEGGGGGEKEEEEEEGEKEEVHEEEYLPPVLCYIRQSDEINARNTTKSRCFFYHKQIVLLVTSSFC